MMGYWSLWVTLAISTCVVRCHEANWRWKGKVAVITGANCEVASAIVDELAEMGTKVVALLKAEDNFVADKSNTNIQTYKCDLSKEDDIIAAFEWTVKNVGNVDVLINNADVYYPGGFIGGSTTEWTNTLSVNVLGAAIACREALKSMTNPDGGHILNLNSIFGHFVDEDTIMGMYTPSKYALTGLTEELQSELNLKKPNNKIKVTSVSRGPMKTSTSLNEGYATINTDDLLDAIIFTLNTKPGVVVNDVMIYPLESTHSSTTRKI